MIKHPDGSITELPAIKLHPKQESTLLQQTSMTPEDVKVAAQAISNYIED